MKRSVDMHSSDGAFFANPWQDMSRREQALRHPEVERFHRSLPESNTTSLTPLPAAARALGLGSIWVKDESFRFGLPAFKILGASWAVYRAVAQQVNRPPTVSLAELGVAARANNVRLVTCTDGNWGRGVARMAKYLDIPVRVYVPNTMDEETRHNIHSEGAEVETAAGDYDVSIRAAQDEAQRSGALLVMDVAWTGYEQVPTWVVEGYSTMLAEVDRQLEATLGRPADLAIASVGVGSFAQAVTTHFKHKHPPAVVVGVEATNAPCLRRSLEAGSIVSVQTEETIMCGMNCGTLSTTAWPVLASQLDACVVVTDLEAHDAVLAMKHEGVEAGPCGAAPLAALRRLVSHGHLDLGPDSHVVLFCTEGARPYRVPLA